MEQSKQHLSNIIVGLKDECGFQHIRVAYIGYKCLLISIDCAALLHAAIRFHLVD